MYFPESEWYTALEQPEWLTLIVAVFALGIIAWQSWETRKAAQASNKSVDAAIRSERARVMPELVSMVKRKPSGQWCRWVGGGKTVPMDTK